MNDLRTILTRYTAGLADDQTTNDALAAGGFGLRLVPGKNRLTDDEVRATTIGALPEMANGFGLLDTGTGTCDKCRVVQGRIQGFDAGGTYAAVCLAGRWYFLDGDRLVNEDPNPPREAPDLPEGPDLSKHREWADTVREQRTARGLFRISYDECGYAVRAERV